MEATKNLAGAVEPISAGLHTLLARRQRRFEDGFELTLNPIQSLLNGCKTDIVGGKTCVQIATQIIDTLVHRLLIEPACAKDADDEGGQGNDDGDDERIHRPIISIQVQKDYG